MAQSPIFVHIGASGTQVRPESGSQPGVWIQAWGGTGKSVKSLGQHAFRLWSVTIEWTL